MLLCWLNPLCKTLCFNLFTFMLANICSHFLKLHFLFKLLMNVRPTYTAFFLHINCRFLLSIYSLSTAFLHVRSNLQAYHNHKLHVNPLHGMILKQSLRFTHSLPSQVPHFIENHPLPWHRFY